MSELQMLYKAKTRRMRYYTREELEFKEKHQCLVCGKPTKRYAWKGLEGEKYKTFCSNKCSNEWWISRDWSSIRLHFLNKHKDNMICNKCKKQIDLGKYGISFTYNFLQVDHIVPISLGGNEFDESNLQILCIECAKRKNSRDAKNLRNFKMSYVAISNIRYLFDRKLFFEKRYA